MYTNENDQNTDPALWIDKQRQNLTYQIGRMKAHIRHHGADPDLTEVDREAMTRYLEVSEHFLLHTLAANTQITEFSQRMGLASEPSEVLSQFREYLKTGIQVHPFTIGNAAAQLINAATLDAAYGAWPQGAPQPTSPYEGNPHAAPVPIALTKTVLQSYSLILERGQL